MDWIKTLLPPDAEWDEARRAEADDGHDILVCVRGDGTPEAPQVVGITCNPPIGEDGARLPVRVPSMTEIGEALDLMASAGGVFQLPQLVAGMPTPDGPPRDAFTDNARAGR